MKPHRFHITYQEGIFVVGFAMTMRIGKLNHGKGGQTVHVFSLDNEPPAVIGRWLKGDFR